VLDSVESIASGGVGKVASMIESTQAKALPMVISWLASLLGLGGSAEKIKTNLEKIQKPVGKVVDGIIAGVMKFGKKMLGKLKKKKKDKDQPDERTDAQKQAAVHAAVTAGEALAKAPKATVASVKKGLSALKTTHKLVSLDLVKDGKDQFHVHGKINPEDDGKSFNLLDIKEVTIGGKAVKCAVTEGAIVPIDKVLIYGAGKVAPPTAEQTTELAQLRAELEAEYKERMDKGERLPKKANYQLVDAAKQAKLTTLDRLEHNYDRSMGNLKSLTTVGLDATAANLETIIAKIADAGGKVDLTVESSADIKVEAPRGPLIVTTKWRESPDGRKQLVTIMFKSPK
jgi:hypothetical protein